MPFFFFLFLLSPAGAPPPPPPRIVVGQFKPGIAIIVALLTTIFSITFLLLLYMKHCKRGEEAAAYVAAGVTSSTGNATSSSSSSYYYQTTSLGGRNSGVDRKVIESLPMFRFSSLTGQKDGLECAVCLNRFEPEEVLRLLPKCKHAFHVECVDTWLDAHSTCPLCRYRVDPEDVLLLDSVIIPAAVTVNVNVTPRISNHKKEKYVNPRISGRHSSAGETTAAAAMEVISENHQKHDLRGRVSLDSWHAIITNSRRKLGGIGKQQNHHQDYYRKIRKDGNLLHKEEKNHQQHRVEHRIVISSSTASENLKSDMDLEIGRRRWSDAQAAEILYLKSEKMMMMGSGRSVNNERSVSEITGVSRYGHGCSNNGDGKQKEQKEQKKMQQGQEEERVVRRWLDWISSHSSSSSHSSTSISSNFISCQPISSSTSTSTSNFTSTL